MYGSKFSFYLENSENGDYIVSLIIKLINKYDGTYIIRRHNEDGKIDGYISIDFYIYTFEEELCQIDKNIKFVKESRPNFKILASKFTGDTGVFTNIE